MSAKRNLRPRAASQYACQREWNLDEDDVLSVRRFNAVEKFNEEKFNCDHGLVYEMSGDDFTLSYVQEHGLTQPLVFRNAQGLGMKIPQDDFTVQDVKRLVGPRRVVDVMDTRTQEASTMTLSQWARYYDSKPRHKLLNVISLEFSCTKLDPLVMPPTMVSQLDWVELMWPSELKSSQTDPTNDLRRMMYPKVQKYCLMSVAGCYTDFHVDFGGTSVWYHVLKGEKHFLLIPPSAETYDLFQTWHMSGEQESIFFAELVAKAQLVKLQAGDTFIMPSGWIHAVYTPIDSLVFGGNFLHSFNIPQQLRVAAMENSTKVPSKFRYPFYGTMHWYVVERYHSQLAKLGNTGTGGEGRNSTPLPTKEDQVGGANDGEEEEDPSQPLSSVPINNRKWLKGVALDKVQVSSGSTTRRSSIDFIAESAQPYLSTYERDGLLALVQEMLGAGELFIPDAPHTYPNPRQLLEELRDQLQCSGVEKVCASRPTGVGLVPAQPISRRGSGSIRRRKKGGSDAVSPRKRGRKVDEDGTKSVKVQKKDEKLLKRKVARKRKRKPLLVSLPRSLMMRGALGGEREEISQNGGQGDGEMSVTDTGNSELVPDKVEEGGVKDEEEYFEVIRLESEQPINIALSGQLLTPPMSLSSASADSISPSPSPSPIPPSSSLTPSSSHPFTLKLELDSPIMSCATPLSQATPTSQSTTLHLLSQETHTNSPDSLPRVESAMAPSTGDSISE